MLQPDSCKYLTDWLVFILIKKKKKIMFSYLESLQIPYIFPQIPSCLDPWYPRHMDADRNLLFVLTYLCIDCLFLSCFYLFTCFL